MTTPEDTMREVVNDCTNCDFCRYLMDTNCLFFPEIYILQSPIKGGFIKKSLGIHPKRKMPLFPAQSFPSWAKRHNLVVKPAGTTKRKVAYFAGCSARYIYPELAKAVDSVFQRNGIGIYYPTQQCCGMPSMLEGDRKYDQAGLETRSILFRKISGFHWR